MPAAGTAVTVGNIQHAVGDVAAEGLVQNERRRQAATIARFCTPIHRAVCTDPSWLMNEIQALLT